MGYTHYWRIEGNCSEQDYRKALIDCKKIIKASPVPLGGADGEGKPDLVDGIAFNGVGDDGCETFGLDFPPRLGFDFCKTNNRPYDVVVVACLCALDAHGIGDVSSDGEVEDWEAGLAFAKKVLRRSLIRRSLKNPLEGQ